MSYIHAFRHSKKLEKRQCRLLIKYLKLNKKIKLGYCISTFYKLEKRIICDKSRLYCVMFIESAN